MHVAASSDVTKLPKMRQLGDSDLIVSDICLGTMTWGKQNTEQEAHAQLSYAFDSGINFLDTAEMYPVPVEAATQGTTDRYISTWLKNQKREDVILATKVCGRSDRVTWVREGDESPKVDRKNIMYSVEKSLMRLNTDYIDLLQIHWPDRYVPLFGAAAYDASNEYDAEPFEAQLEAFDELIQQGKVRHLGVSNETSYGVSEFCYAAERNPKLPKIVSIQNSYSLIVRSAFETDLAEVCSPSHKNVGLLAYSPLAGGALSGKYLNNTPEGARFTLFPGYMDRFNKSQAVDAVKEYTKIAEKYGMTPSEMALVFCKSRWFVTSTIIGATSLDQLKENIDAFDLEMSDEMLEDINQLYKKYRDPATST